MFRTTQLVTWWEKAKVYTLWQSIAWIKVEIHSHDCHGAISAGRNQGRCTAHRQHGRPLLVRNQWAHMGKWDHAHLFSVSLYSRRGKERMARRVWQMMQQPCLQIQLTVGTLCTQVICNWHHNWQAVANSDQLAVCCRPLLCSRCLCTAAMCKSFPFLLI